MSTPSFTFEPARGGWMAVCACGWERYEARRSSLDTRRLKHTCAKTRTATADKPRPVANWAAREDSTWIDKL